MLRASGKSRHPVPAGLRQAAGRAGSVVRPDCHEHAGATAAGVPGTTAGNVPEEVEVKTGFTTEGTELHRGRASLRFLREPSCPSWLMIFITMPELPEVETIARGLAKRVTG